MPSLVHAIEIYPRWTKWPQYWKHVEHKFEADTPFFSPKREGWSKTVVTQVGDSVIHQLGATLSGMERGQMPSSMHEIEVYPDWTNKPEYWKYI